MKRAVSTSSVGDDEEPCRDHLVGADFLSTLRDIRRGEPVEDGTVGLAARESQHSWTKRAEQDGRSFDDGPRQLEAMYFERLIDLVDFLPVEGAPQEAQRVARPREGLLVGNAVPAFDDRLTRGAETHREPATGDFRHGGDAHREQSRAASEDRRHGDAEVEPRLGERRRPSKG